MFRTALKIALLIVAVLLLSGAGVSLAVYGSVDPCEMLAEERARSARETAEEALEPATGPEDMQEAAEQAREVLGRATGRVAEAAAEAETSVEGMGATGCAGELWSRWF